MTTTTVAMARNLTGKPLVFSDRPNNVMVEFGRSGIEDGSDVQAIPEAALSLPAFARLVQRNMVELMEADDEYVQQAGDRAVADAEQRTQRYKTKIEDAREADPQQRDLVFKVEESERQGKVPVYTPVEDKADQTTARVHSNTETSDLGSVAGAGDFDEDGKPTTPDVKVTVGEPLPSET